LIPIPLGSSVSFLHHNDINSANFNFEGTKTREIKRKLDQFGLYVFECTLLWGGKTPFGIDCSGFTQMVYKLNGFHLLRDASAINTRRSLKLY
jgi:hypothetical protein